ncbi:MAG: hypothetical protein MJ237_02150 [bacterium]|nr:hypothetical protein [bacterium]
MTQLLPQSSMLQVSNIRPDEAIEYINSYIEQNSCKTLDVDISFMNIIDSCYVSTLCSTKHYIKYPDGKINWRISSKLVAEFNKDLELGNSNYIL